MTNEFVEDVIEDDDACEIRGFDIGGVGEEASDLDDYDSEDNGMGEESFE